MGMGIPKAHTPITPKNVKRKMRTPISVVAKGMILTIVLKYTEKRGMSPN